MGEMLLCFLKRRQDTLMKKTEMKKGTVLRDHCDSTFIGIVPARALERVSLSCVGGGRVSGRQTGRPREKKRREASPLCNMYIRWKARVNRKERKRKSKPWPPRQWNWKIVLLSLCEAPRSS